MAIVRPHALILAVCAEELVTAFGALTFPKVVGHVRNFVDSDFVGAYQVNELFELWVFAASL